VNIPAAKGFLCNAIDQLVRAVGDVNGSDLPEDEKLLVAIRFARQSLDVASGFLKKEEPSK
jgi:hypothetical protein